MLLLTEPQAGGDARILGQFVAEGSAPIPGGGPRPDGTPEASEAAAAMSAALAEALAQVERNLVRLLPARR